MTLKRWIACLLLLAGLPMARAQSTDTAPAAASAPESEPGRR